MTKSSASLAPGRRFGLSPMPARDPREQHRVASTLELFFDLVFVIAVGIAGVQLHHALSHGHIEHGVLSFMFIFFCIWWAWMNFSWFATAFDNDDWFYRVTTIVQMGGVLTLAAGIEPFFTTGDQRILMVGYVIMRLAMVAQWVRAGIHNPDYRKTTTIYALGIALVQLYWIAISIIPTSTGLGAALSVTGFALELSVPVIAETNKQTPWHSHHITERYGLFTLIVLGESLLGSANAVIKTVSEVHLDFPLIAMAALVLIVTAGLWWIYFWGEHHITISGVRDSLPYGYLHYFIFASAAAFSAGVEVQIDSLTHESHLSPIAASYALALPVAIFIMAIWWLVIRKQASPLVKFSAPIASLLVLLDPLVPFPAVITTLAIIGLVAVLVANNPQTEAPAE